MKNRVCGFAIVLLAIVMILPILTACSSSDKSEPTITVEVDGQQLVFDNLDNMEGKTIAQLLEEAEIVLNEGDVLAFDHEQTVDGNLTVKVLRRCSITVEVEAEKSNYTAVLVGGTVADAIKAVGIELSDDQTVNYKLDKALEDGMSIIISDKEPENDNSHAASASSSKSHSSGTKSSSSSSSSSSSTAPSEPPSSITSSSDNSDSGSSKSLVGSDDYPDPDGSGHGVRVETYSDGSQVEVEY